MHMVSGIRQEALLLPLGDALVCCVRNRKSLMQMVSGINPSDPNPYYLRFITVIESLMLMISIHKDYENMREISDV